MPLVIAIRNNGEDTIVVTHAGETLLIAVAAANRRKARVLLTGPKSFDIVRKEVLDRRAR